MQLVVIAVGQRVPSWAEAGFQEYARRMTGQVRLELLTIKTEPRSSSNNEQVNLSREAERIRAVLPKHGLTVALDERGRDLTTVELASHLQTWQGLYDKVAFLIGGPDGLAPDLKNACGFCLRLSSLTLPHALARVVLAEQLYRAWSFAQNHPYHRA